MLSHSLHLLSHFYRIVSLFFCIAISFPLQAQLLAEMKRYDEFSRIKFGAYVFDAHQSSDHLLWFSGPGFISGFDGTNSFNFTECAKKKVLHITEDPNGKVWFLTSDGSIYYKDPLELKLSPLDDTLTALSARDRVIGFYVDQDETIHLGFVNKGYYQLTSSGEVHHIAGPETGFRGIHFLEIAKQVPFQFGSSPAKFDQQEFKIVDADLKVIHQLPFNKTLKKLSRKTALRDLQVLKDGRFIYFNDNDLWIITDGAITAHHTFEHRVISVFEDRDGNLWIGTFMGGLHHYPNGIITPTPAAIYLPGKAAAVKTQDFEGGLWVTSDRDALYHIAYPEITWFPPGENKVNITLHETAGKNQLFFVNAHAQWGSIQHDRITLHDLPRTFEQERGNYYVSKIFYDTIQDALWISGSKNHYTYKNKQWSVIAFPDSVEKNFNGDFIRSPLDGSIWSWADNRLLRIKDDQILFTSQKAPALIRGLAISPAGEMWIRTEAGLYQYKNNHFIFLGDQDPRLAQVITHVSHHYGYLWVSSTNNLFAIQGDSIHEVKSKNGLAVQYSGPLTAHKNELWFTSVNGLQNILVQNDKPFEFPVRSYLVPTSLLKDVGTKIHIVGSTIYACSAHGKIAKIPLSSLSDDYILQEPWIARIQINKRDTAIKNEFEVPYDLNHFTVYFNAPSYEADLPPYFSCKLKGVDTEWKLTDRLYAEYPRLQPGEYTFMVSTKRQIDDDWLEPVSIKITINPPYWETWWFRTLIVLGFIGIAYLIFRYQLKRVKTENHLKNLSVKYQQQALSAQMNPHFIFNCMNSVQQFILKNRNEEAFTYLGNFGKLIRRVMEQSAYEYIPLQEELETLKLYLELEKQRMEQGFDYTITVDPALNPSDIEIPPLLIQPYVENAVWHGVKPLKSGGKIELQFSPNETGGVACSIADNGVGRQVDFKQGTHKSFGMEKTASRLQILAQKTRENFAVQITDLFDQAKNPTGTRVEVVIPGRY